MLRIMLLCVLLVGCSSDVERFPQNLPPAPSLSTAAAVLKTVAAEAHLAEPVEVSDPIRANPISSSPWLICLRSGKSEQSKRITYSAFQVRFLAIFGDGRSLRGAGLPSVLVALSALRLMLTS